MVCLSKICGEFKFTYDGSAQVQVFESFVVLNKLT